MPLWLNLLKPPAVSLKNIIRRPGQGGRLRFVFLSIFGLVIWIIFFAFTIKVLGYLQEVEVLGEVLSRRFLSLLWVAGVGLLMFSGIISALSVMMLSKDIEMLMASPISLENIFWARSTQAILVSTWMPLAFMIPIFLAYGVVFKASPLYYLVAPLATIPLLAGAGYLSQILVLVLVNVFPARRTKEIMGLIAILGVFVLFITIRIMRPDELINPAGFMSVAAYLASLEGGSGNFILPTEWALEAVWPLLSGKPGPMHSLVWLAFLWSTVAALAVITSYVASAIYWPGYNKSLEGASRKLSGRFNIIGSGLKLLGRFLPPMHRALVVKDLKIFFRDHSQWSQLLLLGALLAIYIYNLSVLNLDRFPGSVIVVEIFFSFTNMGLVALVASVLALRFAFPSISGEGFAYWIIRSAPLTLDKFMKIKFWLWFPPIWVSAMILIYIGNYYLDLTPAVNGLSIGLIALLTPGLCALAIGMGASFPRFDAPSLAQVPTGYGGLIYMIISSLSTLLVIGLAAWPIIYFFSIESGKTTPSTPLLALSIALLAGALTICLALWFLPMKRGLKDLVKGSGES